jgi:hypothetical protein
VSNTTGTASKVRTMMATGPTAYPL